MSAPPPLFGPRIVPGAIIGSHVTDDGYPLRSFAWPFDRESGRRGAILFLGGRDDFFEKYDDSFAHWHARGWSVDAFDWRGHGGSPRTTDDPSIRHGASFARLVADLTHYCSAWRTRVAGPHVIMGHSMGGHLLLRAILDRRVMPDGAILLSPMIRIRTPFGSWLSERIARRQVARGHGHAGPWSESDSEANSADRFAMMTTDVGRYVEEQAWIEHNPEFGHGPPSWAWLADAFTSSRVLRRDLKGTDIAVPLLLMVADNDRLTNSAAARRSLARHPLVESHRFGRGVAHELLRELEPVRRRALAIIDAFIDRIAAAR
jgi:lysophospholipase